MKKIAFITSGHTGATLPLAKELLSLGHSVDFYFLLGEDGNKEQEAVSLGDFPNKKGLHQIETKYYKELEEYMNSNLFRMLYIRTTRPFKTIPILRGIVKLWRHIEYKYISESLNKEKYDLINLVGRIDCDDFIFFHKMLDNKIVTSLHEVCNHWNPDFKSTPPILKYLFNKGKDIVVHSNNSYKDILKYKNVDINKIHHINFGTFETFKTLHGFLNIELPENYILFFGAIRPYKGLTCLLDAIKKHPDCLGDNKLVIAGSGFDDSLLEFKEMENVIIINRYIKNEEVVYLLEHCKFVVCPYLTMSQSGLPQTIYAFRKPIIASDLDGFKEVVIDKEIGLLFKNKDCEELANAIKFLSDDKKLYDYMVDNINNFENINKEFSWNYIAGKYLELIN